MNLKNIYSKLLKEKRQFLNQVFGDKNYRKFVIISRSRTGSTLLMALLNKHENIVCEGEVFKNLNGKTCLEIWNSLFCKKQKKIKQVGFKLFYYHPFDNDKSVWKFLQNDTDITIVHLVRTNYLRAFVSQKIGEKTKQWSESVYKPHNLNIDDKRVKLDYRECVETFEKVEKYEIETRRKFQDHSFIEVTYEDLSYDKEEVIEQILQKLDLPVQKLNVVNKKQNAEELSDLISNYEEFKSAFSGTRWNKFFH